MIIRKLPERSAPTLLAPPVAQASPTETNPTAYALLSTPSSARPAVLKPLAPARYKLQLTITRETQQKLRLDLLLRDLERRKLATAKHPRLERERKSSSRNIPAAVRRAVWRRDDGRCAFVGAAGRCCEAGFLEFHHVRPTYSSERRLARASPVPRQRRSVSYQPLVSKRINEAPLPVNAPRRLVVANAVHVTVRTCRDRASDEAVRIVGEHLDSH